MKEIGYTWRLVPGSIPQFVRRVSLPMEGHYHKAGFPVLSVGDSISKSALCAIHNEHIWACGDFYEVTRCRESSIEGVPPPSGAAQKAAPESEESIRARSVARARRRVRRLVNTNRLYDMITLTLAPDISVLDSRYGEKWVQIPIEVQKDRGEIVKLWDGYRRRMREARGKDFPYVAVIEKHTGKRSGDATIKTGTYHVHYCTRLGIGPEKIKVAEGFIQRIWGHGLCNITPWNRGRRSSDLGPIDLPPAANPGAYMSKYFGEKSDVATGREENKRRYWCSRGLLKPKRLMPEEIEARELKLVWENIVTVDGKQTMVSQTYRSM